MSHAPQRWPQSASRSASEDGSALVVALLALLIVTAIGLSLISLSSLSMMVSTNDVESVEAFYAADAGIAHGLRLVRGMGLATTQALQRGNGTACDGDELSGTPGAPFTAADGIPSPANGGVVFAPTGSYQVFVCDDHAVESAAAGASRDTNPSADNNGTILVRALGIGRNGARLMLEVAYSSTTIPTLLIDGDLQISGNPEVTGPGGAVHANGRILTNGHPCSVDYFSATGTITTSGSRTGTACGGSGGSWDQPSDTRPNQAAVAIPAITITDYRSSSDYILTSNGRIRRPDGTQVANATSGCWNTWCWDPGNLRWTGGDNIPAGTYYGDGTNIEISGNPGASSGGRAISLIATGWINISGNPRLTPALNDNGMSISMVAGTDLQISGNASSTYSGLHYAGHQIAFNGNPLITGNVIADNNADTGSPQNLVVRASGGYMKISGNPTIVAPTGGSGFGARTAAAWRECRGAAVATPCG
jgi:hypothetical protein